MKHSQQVKLLGQCSILQNLERLTIMKPIIIDQHTGKELWTGPDCATYIGVTPATWRNYSANQRTPAPVATILGKTHLWDAEEVKTWHANRPGSPVKNSPGGTRKAE